MMVKFDGKKQAIEMLQGLGPAEQERLLSKMAEQDPARAEELKGSLVGFEDLIHLTTKMIQDLLRDIPPSFFGLAFRASSTELQNHFFSNVSEGIKQEIIDQLRGGLKPISEVEKAKREILEVVKKKIAEGSIILNKDGRDELV